MSTDQDRITPTIWIKTRMDQSLIEAAKSRPKRTVKFSYGKVWKIVHDTYMTLAKSLDVIYSDVVNLVLYCGSINPEIIYRFTRDYHIPDSYYLKLYSWIKTSALRLEPIPMYPSLRRILDNIGPYARDDMHFELLIKYGYRPIHGWGEYTRIWRGLYDIYKIFARTINSYIFDAVSDMIVLTSLSPEVMDIVLQKYLKIERATERSRVMDWIMRSFKKGRVEDPREIEGIVSGNEYKHTEIVMKILRTARESRKKTTRW